MATWTHANLAGVTAEKVVELSAKGMSQREIADELGISKSTVLRRQKEAGIEIE